MYVAALRLGQQPGTDGKVLIVGSGQTFTVAVSRIKGQGRFLHRRFLSRERLGHQQGLFPIVYQFGVQERDFVTPAFAGVQIHSLFRRSNGFRLAPG